MPAATMTTQPEQVKHLVVSDHVKSHDMVKLGVCPQPLTME